MNHGVLSLSVASLLASIIIRSLSLILAIDVGISSVKSFLIFGLFSLMILSVTLSDYLGSLHILFESMKLTLNLFSLYGVFFSHVLTE